VRAALLVVGVLALGALAAAAGPGGSGPVPVRQSTCWECHATWTPALTVPTTLALVGDASAPVGGTFQPRLLVQNAWQAEIRAVALLVDLSQAPSLAFRSSTPPLRANVTLVLHGDPTQPTLAAARETTLNLSASPSGSRVRVVPASADPTLGPRLAVVLGYPDGHVVRSTAPGRGQAIELPGALDGVVGGVRIRVELPGVQVAAQNLTAYTPPVQDVPARVEVAADFDYAKLRKAGLSVPVLVAKARSLQLAALNLTVLGEPAAGERVGFLLNTTVHYAHPSPPRTGDWANWTQETLWVPLEARAGRVGLQSVAVPPPPLPVNGPTMTTVGEAVGYTGAFLIISSIASGGMLGKASRRGLNALFGSAKRRVAFHNFLSYGLMLAALAHMALFLVGGDFRWTQGILWGGLSMLAMFGLGVTGALQVILVRRWSYGAWRVAHYGLAVAVIALTLAHLVLEGKHFGAVQGTLHYSDPFAR
jgi:hypothetical protein